MNKEIRIALFWAGGIILLSLAATVLKQMGIIDQETVIRTVAMNGLAIVYYGNRAPKIAPHNQTALKIARFSGWSSVLSGLIYAGMWAFAPIDTAVIVGTGAVLVGVIATLIYCYQMRHAIKAEGQSASVG